MQQQSLRARAAKPPVIEVAAAAAAAAPAAAPAKASAAAPAAAPAPGLRGSAVQMYDKAPALIVDDEDEFPPPPPPAEMDSADLKELGAKPPSAPNNQYALLPLSPPGTIQFFDNAEDSDRPPWGGAPLVAEESKE